ncbi:MAG: 50S ribosomal protein L2 [Proteobacteria bacterium]|jgi:large subunit ribosomal protein L2|nr:50S ribosomal protein L2 [Pseudomonadota bacterium]
MKTYRPTSPAIRKKSVESFDDLEKTSKKLPRELLTSISKSGGRNNHGHMTLRHRGQGHKRLYRMVQFRRQLIGVPAVVDGFYYDPNRTSRLALLNYSNGKKGLILAPVGLKKGDKVETGPEADIRPGNALPLRNMPVGSTIHCVELKPGKGSQLVRSAGTAAMLLGKEGEYAQVRLPSGEVRLVPMDCYATLGQVGNIEHETLVIGKAGRNRWKGFRPKNRGTSMNPVDHPHGGGEGRAKGGRHPVSPWGQPTKGYKTRNNKRTDAFIIRGRPRGKMTASGVK